MATTTISPSTHSSTTSGPRAASRGSVGLRSSNATQLAPASIISPLEQHMARRASSRPNLIVNWVHRLEKINATLDEGSQETGGGGGLGGATTGSEQRAGSRVGGSLIDGGHYAKSQGPPASQQYRIVSIIGNSNNQAEVVDEDDSSELCFKAAQLVTEFLLMLFAASLLIIVTIVVFSRQIPAFMESYDIVPKILFFLCVFVATYSFVLWLATKLSRKFKLFTRISAGPDIKHSEDGGDEQKGAHAMQDDATNPRRLHAGEEATEQRQQHQEDGHLNRDNDNQSELQSLLHSNQNNRSTRANLYDQSNLAHSCAQPLLSSSSSVGSNKARLEPGQVNQRHHHQQQLANRVQFTGPAVTTPWPPSSCHPPTRQVTTAYDLYAVEAGHIINEEEDYTDSDELSCASA